MKIYFAGSIRGGRSKINDYAKIIDKLKEMGEVLTVHVASPELSSSGETLSYSKIYDRDMQWLKQSDLVVAEVSLPSLGVGYEIAKAESFGKKIICFYDNSSEKVLSAMIGGNPNIEVIRYNNISEVIDYLDNLKINE